MQNQFEHSLLAPASKHDLGMQFARSNYSVNPILPHFTPFLPPNCFVNKRRAVEREILNKMILSSRHKFNLANDLLKSNGSLSSCSSFKDPRSSIVSASSLLEPQIRPKPNVSKTKKITKKRDNNATVNKPEPAHTRIIVGQQDTALESKTIKKVKSSTEEPVNQLNIGKNLNHSIKTEASEELTAICSNHSIGENDGHSHNIKEEYESTGLSPIKSEISDSVNNLYIKVPYLSSFPNSFSRGETLLTYEGLEEMTNRMVIIHNSESLKTDSF